MSFDIVTPEFTKEDILIKCAETSLNSKLLSHEKNKFAKMVVKAV